VDIQALLANEGQALVGTQDNPLALARAWAQAVNNLVDSSIRDGLAAVRSGTDLIISAGVAEFAGLSLAEAIGVPELKTNIMPWGAATAAMPFVLFPQLRGHALLHRLGHLLGHQLTWQPMRPAVSRARRAILGLGPAPWLSMDAGGAHPLRRRTLLGYSRHVVPPPPDWPESYEVTGYWQLNLPVTWSPPADLVAFLERGPAPIYIGFGSMTSRRDAGATSAALITAVQRLGVRAVIASGWGGIQVSDLPPSIYSVTEAQHQWLFPQMAAVVHHGGAGTTGAAFHAGVPQVIVPHMADQPFWGQRVSELGVGPRPIPVGALSADRLAQALQHALSDAVRRRASAIGAAIGAEQGVEYAVAAIERALQR
jgi:UDP:flavonoid glycosyltransferase YjiC (YdhE family)